MSLYTAGVIEYKYDEIVKIVAFYVPIVTATSFAVYASNVLAKLPKETVLFLDANKQKILRKLENWNKDHFHPIGFSWTYNNRLDCLQLDVDSNLEIYD